VPGNVEILHDGKWGSICDDEWDDLEAGVVCRQLGFNGAIKATANGHFGQARSETRYYFLSLNLSRSFAMMHHETVYSALRVKSRSANTKQ